MSASHRSDTEPSDLHVIDRIKLPVVKFLGVKMNNFMLFISFFRWCRTHTSQKLIYVSVRFHCSIRVSEFFKSNSTTVGLDINKMLKDDTFVRFTEKESNVTTNEPAKQEMLRLEDKESENGMSGGSKCILH